MAYPFMMSEGSAYQQIVYVLSPQSTRSAVLNGILQSSCWHVLGAMALFSLPSSLHLADSSSKEHAQAR